MPIITIQRRLREAGRIRTGTKGPKGNPVKLQSLRFTSADLSAIEAVARLYGGEVKKWVGAPVGEQFEVITEATSIPVVVPAAEMSFSQFMEMWSGGGCQRRCDGERELIKDTPCLCDADEPECKPTTRLSVMLPELETLGTWRLESHGWNAAAELKGAVELVQAAGLFIPADLRLEQRQSKREGTTRNFAVPVLDLRVSVAQLASGVSDRPTLTPVAAPALPAASVADQVHAVNEPPARSQRANGAEPMKRSGRPPRTAEQAKELGSGSSNPPASNGASSDAAPAPSDHMDTAWRNGVVVRLAKAHVFGDEMVGHVVRHATGGRSHVLSGVKPEEAEAVIKAIASIESGELVITDAGAQMVEKAS